MAILVRGRRWPRGSFPRDDADLKAGWLLQVGGGLFHRRNPLRLWSDLTTLDIEAADTVGQLSIGSVGTLKLASSIRGDAFNRRKRAAAVARFLTYFSRSAQRGMMRQNGRGGH
jgi:hypothetical protein